jgi:hypothetical protein
MKDQVSKIGYLVTVDPLGIAGDQFGTQLLSECETSLSQP